MNVASRLAVVLFGSEARGEHDVHSDRDICVFVENDLSLDARASALARLAGEFESTPRSVCIYSRRVAQTMASSGSLFLWHLKVDGRILEDSGDFARRLLAELKPYSGYARDIAQYRNILESVAADLETYGRLTAADWHAVFGVARNSCMVLTMKAGLPSFSRKAAFATALATFPTLALTNDTYHWLASWHLLYVRGVGRSPDPPTAYDSTIALSQVRSVLDLLEAQTNG